MNKRGKYQKSIFSQALPGETILYPDLCETYPQSIEDHIEHGLETLVLFLNARVKQKSRAAKAAKLTLQATPKKSPKQTLDHEPYLSTLEAAKKHHLTYESARAILENTAQKFKSDHTHQELVYNLIHRRANTSKILDKEISIDIAHEIWLNYLAVALVKYGLQQHESAWKAIKMASFYNGLIEGFNDTSTEGIKKRASAGGLGKAKIQAEKIATKNMEMQRVVAIMLKQKPEKGWHNYLDAVSATMDAVLTLIKDENLNITTDETELKNILTNLAVTYKMNTPSK